MVAKSLEILKSAILLEKKGYAFYTAVAEQATGQSVKKFFEEMAQEEMGHIDLLSRQYRSLQKNKKFDEEDFGLVALTKENEVLTKDVMREIESASYEAAAITAAMHMERNAVDLYAHRAKEASDVDEKRVYQWLADFERKHLEELVNLDRDIQEKIWYDNHFWPM